MKTTAATQPAFPTVGVVPAVGDPVSFLFEAETGIIEYRGRVTALLSDTFARVYVGGNAWGKAEGNDEGFAAAVEIAALTVLASEPETYVGRPA